MKLLAPVSFRRLPMSGVRTSAEGGLAVAMAAAEGQIHALRRARQEHGTLGRQCSSTMDHRERARLAAQIGVRRNC